MQLATRTNVLLIHGNINLGFTFEKHFSNVYEASQLSLIPLAVKLTNVIETNKIF